MFGAPREWQKTTHVRFGEQLIDATIEGTLSGTVNLFEYHVLLGEGIRLTENLADEVFQCGCDDCTIIEANERVTLDFTREAKSIEDALRSSVSQLRSAGIEVSSIELDPDQLLAA